LEASLAPQIKEGDDRKTFLKSEIDGYKDKVSRLNKVLKSHTAAERRKRFLKKQNHQNR